MRQQPWGQNIAATAPLLLLYSCDNYNYNDSDDSENGNDRCSYGSRHGDSDRKCSSFYQEESRERREREREAPAGEAMQLAVGEQSRRDRWR